MARKTIRQLELEIGTLKADIVKALDQKLEAQRLQLMARAAQSQAEELVKRLNGELEAWREAHQVLAGLLRDTVPPARKAPRLDGVSLGANAPLGGASLRAIE